MFTMGEKRKILIRKLSKYILKLCLSFIFSQRLEILLDDVLGVLGTRVKFHCLFRRVLIFAKSF